MRPRLLPGAAARSSNSGRPLLVDVLADEPFEDCMHGLAEAERHAGIGVELVEVVEAVRERARLVPGQATEREVAIAGLGHRDSSELVEASEGVEPPRAARGTAGGWFRREGRTRRGRRCQSGRGPEGGEAGDAEHAEHGVPMFCTMFCTRNARDSRALLPLAEHAELLPGSFGARKPFPTRIYATCAWERARTYKKGAPMFCMFCKRTYQPVTERAFGCRTWPPMFYDQHVLHVEHVESARAGGRRRA